jgi:hypothetical protein
MLRALGVVETGREWLVPVIQGHYGGFEVNLGTKRVSYHLLSRRSKYRSGTRFFSRGIDENSKCAQFVESEQMVGVEGEMLGLVVLSGSPPLFWEQKWQGDKVRLTRNK